MKKRILTLGVVFSLICSGCSAVKSVETSANAETGEETTQDSLHATSNTVSLTEGKYSEEKLDSTWDEKTASKIELEKKEIKVSGEGAKVSESSDTMQRVTITEEGTYVVSGEIENGQIVINLENKGSVKLVLSDAVITCETSSPIYAKSGDVIITLAEGTKNAVTDGDEYDSVTESEREPSACIFAKDDLTFNGTGSLEVNGNYKNGIQSKDALKFVTGTYWVTAVNNGFVGKDSVSVRNGNFSIAAGNDGIKVTNIEESDKGFIIIDDGTFEIQSSGDAIQAETLLLINEGVFDIVTGGGSAAVTENGATVKDDVENMTDTHMNSDTNPNDTTEDSAKGLKSYVDIVIEGGGFTVDSNDDSIHSNHSITVNDCSMVLTTGDDGMHADEELTVNGGTIDIRKSYEGMEALSITINDGTIHIVASDDGINAAGGSNDATENPNMQHGGGGRMNGQFPGEITEDTDPDAKSPGEKPENLPEGEKQEELQEGEKPENLPEGEKPEGLPKDADTANMDRPEQNAKNTPGGMNSNQGATLEINGGTIYVNASGDGLDANGSITMTGGMVEVQGPESGGDGSFDFDETFVILGGTISSVGSAGMVQNPSESSTQPFIAGTASSSIAKGTVIALKDQSGKEIVSITAQKEIQWYCFSSPDIKEGGTYTVYVGGTETNIVIKGIVNKM